MWWQMVGYKGRISHGGGAACTPLGLGLVVREPVHTVGAQGIQMQLRWMQKMRPCARAPPKDGVGLVLPLDVGYPLALSGL